MIRRAFLTLSLIMGLLCASQAQIMMLFSSDSLTNTTSPLDLDSLFYWFAADVGVTDSLGGAIANNEGVGTWEDLSGNGYNVTQTTNTARPVYKTTGGPGSKPCIQFDGSNDFLASAAHWWGSDDLTVFVVMKFGNATRDAAEIVFSKGDATGSTKQFHAFWHNAANSYLARFTAYKTGDANTGYSYIYKNNDKFSTFSSVVFVNNGSTAGAYYKDGVTQSVTTTTLGVGDWTIYDSATPRFMLGAQHYNSPSAFLQGSISEIIIYSRALTAAERGAIENYLNKKYDLY